MRASEAMALAGINQAGRPVEEAWLTAECRTCGTKQALADCSLNENGQQTEYVCVKGCGVPIVIVGPAPALQGGYRLKDNVVLPTGGMWITPAAA